MRALTAQSLHVLSSSVMFMQGGKVGACLLCFLLQCRFSGKDAYKGVSTTKRIGRPSHFTRPVTPRPPPRAVSHEDLGTPCGRACGQERRERSPAEKGIARSRRTSWRRHSLLGTETLTLRCQAYLRASMWSVLPPAQWVGSQAWPCRARSPGPFGIQARSL